jgi:hypothetical protein
MAKKTNKKETLEQKVLNPLNPGVSYEAFLNELGDTPIEKYLSGIVTDEELVWLNNEISNYLTNNKPQINP